jgi:energy-coupling factor transport system substrate-specific component
MRAIRVVTYSAAAGLGLLAFAHPFLDPTGAALQGITSLWTAGLVALSLVALIVEAQGQAIGAKTVAMLGVLVSVASVLRFVELAVPLPGGFSPIFAPILIAGYVFGSRFGFLMGIFTLLVSALVTGGLGPWLPYQMFASGWVGLTAGWLRLIWRRDDGGPGYERARLVGLGAFGLLWGLLYGLALNLYFWPYAMGPAAQRWEVGIGLGEALRRYAAFYIATSLLWDVARGVGNTALVLLVGAPMVRALARFRRRFRFEVQAHA